MQHHHATRVAAPETRNRFSGQGNRLEVPGRQPQGPPDRPLVRRRDAWPKAGRCAQDIAGCLWVVPRKYAVTRVDKNFESGDASSPALLVTDPSSCDHLVEVQKETLCLVASVAAFTVGFLGLCSSLRPSPRRLDQRTRGSWRIATNIRISNSPIQVPKLRGHFIFESCLPGPKTLPGCLQGVSIAITKTQVICAFYDEPRLKLSAFGDQ